jgi:thiol-disulfide isomerase/thioredoxin
MITTVTSLDQLNKFIQKKKCSIFLKCGATWCKPCDKIKPFYKNKSETDNAVYLDLDVDDSEDIVSKYNITTLPTFVCFFNNKEHSRVTGSNEQKLEKWFVLNTAKPKDDK